MLTRWKESLPAQSSCFVIWLGPLTPNIILMDPQLVKTTLVQTKVFQKSFVYDAIRYVVPEGITNAEGDRWKFLRRLVTPCFHNQVVELLVSTMAETGKSHLKRWEQEVQARKGFAHSINIHALISRLTLSIIMKTTLGRDLTPDSSTYHEFGSRVLGVPHSFFDWIVSLHSLALSSQRLQSKNQKIGKHCPRCFERCPGCIAIGGGHRTSGKQTL